MVTNGTYKKMPRDRVRQTATGGVIYRRPNMLLKDSLIC